MRKPEEKPHAAAAVVELMEVSLAGIQGTREAAARDAAAEQGYHVTSEGLAAMVKDNQLNFVKALGGGDGAFSGWTGSRAPLRVVRSMYAC
jgi:hypothetical protein